MTHVKAPWTDEQVAALSQWQSAGHVHEFTCPDHSQVGSLIPTIRGWICQFCDYTQDWAHQFMFNVQEMQLRTATIERWKLENRVERLAKALAWADMVFALEQNGVMAISPERLQKTFDDAWGGTTVHDELCRKRFMTFAEAALKVIAELPGI